MDQMTEFLTLMRYCGALTDRHDVGCKKPSGTIVYVLECVLERSNLQELYWGIAFCEM
jgi:hypothetical protein